MHNINVKHKESKYFYFYIIGQNITNIHLVYAHQNEHTEYPTSSVHFKYPRYFK